MNTAILIIDLQNDFVDEHGSEPIQQYGKNALVLNIKRLLEFAKSKRMPVIFTQDTHRDGEDFQSRGMKPHCIRDSWGWQLLSGLKSKEDCVVEKSGYSAFQETKLLEILTEKRIRRLVIVGVYTYLCVKASVLDARKTYEVILLKDCISSDNKEKDESTLKLLQNACEIKTVAQFLEESGKVP